MSFFSNLSTLFGNNVEGQAAAKGKRPVKPHGAPAKSGAAPQPATAQAPGKSSPQASTARPGTRPAASAPTKSGAKPAPAKGPLAGTPGTTPTTMGRPAPVVPTIPAQSVMTEAEVEKLRQEFRAQLYNQAKVEADSVLREAQSKAREIIVEAKDEALANKIKADKESQVILRQAEEQQRDLTIKIDRIDRKLTQLDEREAQIDAQKQKIDQLRQQVEANKEATLTKLEEVSSLTREEAKKQLFTNLETKLTHDMAQFVSQKEETARAEADDKAKEILIEAMKYGATDYVPEYTSSTVALGSEDAKGKIIGKSGRNIHAFERVTGVDVDLDVSATEVKLSCFDPVRREVAKLALEKLIKDGRIQPARIEEIVAKTQKEINKITFDEGRNLCHSLGIYNLPNELMQILGRFKYRFSYGQNLIAHTLEVTRIGVKIAHELGLNVNVVKLGCMLHDIGKVSEEVEGSHVELGVKIAKKFNMPPEVIACIAEHHEDAPFSSFESQAVYIADAISGARPGARYENYDEYVQRLQKLEEIANSYPEVQKSYAIQAGREIRVMLEPARSKDDDVVVLANRIRDEIKKQVTYPGTVTVTVIREERGSAVAN